MIAKDIVDFLSDLVRIDTTNPPGNETAAAQYVKRVLESQGLPARVYEAAPGRGSVICRLKGNGTKRPLMLLSHLDVVNAQPQMWSHPPFSGDVIDGVVWGRGSRDCKGLTAMEMAVLLEVKKNGLELGRDLILAATADEESGGRMGVGWLCENVPDETDAEFCINEGGGSGLNLGTATVFTCNTAEKGVSRLRLVARGEPGHAAIPRSNTAVAKLAEAVVRLSSRRLPIHETPTVRKYLDTVVEATGLPRSSAGVLFHPSLGEGVLPTVIPDRHLRDTINAMLRNTATPTILKAGYRINVIPEEATAEVDGRILPGQSPEDLAREVRDLVGDLVEVHLVSKGTGSESPMDTDLYRAIEETVRQAVPGAVVAPVLSTGATDAKFLRARGTVTYGFAPGLPGEPSDTAHGIDERHSAASLEFGFKTLYQLVKRLCTE